MIRETNYAFSKYELDILRSALSVYKKQLANLNEISFGSWDISESINECLERATQLENKVKRELEAARVNS